MHKLLKESKTIMGKGTFLLSWFFLLFVCAAEGREEQADQKSNEEVIDHWLTKGERSLDIGTKFIYNVAEQSIQQAQKVGDEQKLGRSFLLKGMVLYYRGSYWESLPILRKSLKLTSRNQMAKEERLTNIYLGRVLKVIEEYNRAFLRFRKARKDCEEKGDTLAIGCIMIDLIEFYRAMGNFDKAGEQVGKFQELSSKFDFPKDLVARFYHRYAAVENEKGNPEKAIELSKKSLSFSRSIVHQSHMATSYNELAQLYFEQGDIKTSMKYLDKAEKLRRTLGQYRGLLAVNLKRVRIEKAQGNYKKALQLGKECLSTAQEQSWPGFLALVHGSLADTYEKLGKYEQANSHLKSKNSYMLDKVRNAHSSRMAELETRFESEQQKRKLAEKDMELQGVKKEASVRTLQRNLFFGGIITLSLVTLFMIYSFRRTKKMNKELEKQKGEVSRVNQNLSSTLAQKDALLKEVHHRVKNNLTVLTSLFKLQEETLDNPKAKSALKESRERMLSMAKVHQDLYRMENSAEIDLQNFTYELYNNLKRTYLDDKMIAKGKIDCDKVSLEVTQAVPVALIINELLSNSFKYACTPSSSKENSLVGLMIKDLGDELSLQVYDNGPGLDCSLDEAIGSGTLGLSLVQILSEQLDGRLTYEKNDLSIFTVRFPKSSLSTPVAHFEAASSRES